MAGGGEASAALNAAAAARKQVLARPSGPRGLVSNLKVFGIAVFACLGGSVGHSIPSFLWANFGTDFCSILLDCCTVITRFVDRPERGTDTSTCGIWLIGRALDVPA